MSLEETLRAIVREEVRAALADAELERVDAPVPMALTLEEASKCANVSERTLRRAISEGRLRSVRWGRSVRVPRVALEEYLAGAA